MGWTLVQTAAIETGGVNSIAFSSPNTAGNVLVVTVFFIPATLPTITVTDTNGNGPSGSYAAGPFLFDTSNNPYIGTWVAGDCVSGANTVIFSSTVPDQYGGSYSRLQISEWAWSGGPTTAQNPLDGSGGTAHANNGSPSSTPGCNLTTSLPNDLIVAVWSQQNNAPTVGTVNGAPCTLIYSASTFNGASEYATATGLGAVTVTGGTNDNGFDFVAMAIRAPGQQAGSVLFDATDF